MIVATSVDIMAFEWDEEKRERNIVCHRIDFVDAVVVFDGRPVITNDSPREGEDRWATTAFIGNWYITVIWTLRGETIRIISARRARNNEKRAYSAIHG